MQKINYYKLTNGVETELDDVDNMEGESGTETNKVIKEAIAKDEAEAIKAKLEEVGATVTIK